MNLQADKPIAAPKLSESKAVFAGPGTGGWGVGLHLEADVNKTKVVSLTAGGIHPVAEKIAKILQRPVVDAYSETVSTEEMICVVIDCGGSARIGIYPMKRVPTINVKPISPSGPLKSHIKEDIFVSGTTVNDVRAADSVDSGDPVDTDLLRTATEPIAQPESTQVKKERKPLTGTSVLSQLAKATAYFTGWLYQCGKDSVNAFVSHVLPMMVGISVLLGAFEFFGLSSFLTDITQYSLGTLPGLILMVLIFSIPVVSRYLGAGASVGQILIVLLGYQIALGNIHFIWIIPALFATNIQAGIDFIPTALMMSKGEEKTVQAGVKAIQYSRLFTGALCVILAYYIALFMGF